MSDIATALAMLNFIVSLYQNNKANMPESTVALILVNIVTLLEWAAELPDHIVKQAEWKSFIKDNLEVFGQFLLRISMG
jgi:hypothetical protein